MRPCLPVHRLRGFTLIEMLVALVIVSFIAGLVGQALFQLSRVERLLEGGQLRGMADSVRAEWVRSAIESLLPGEVGSADRLRGSERELQGLSADVPMLPAPGLARLHLRLVFIEAAGVTQLQLLAPAPVQEAAEAAPVVLLSWPGREGRFRYLDAAGEWRGDWPAPLGPPGAALPRVIAVETGLAEMRLLLAATRASEVPLPTRRQFEAM
jgi:prepilin-type N-terminal cleavage/methylation domain-containing protein